MTAASDGLYHFSAEPAFSVAGDRVRARERPASLPVFSGDDTNIVSASLSEDDSGVRRKDRGGGMMVGAGNASRACQF
jgi:hypothetical protein